MEMASPLVGLGLLFLFITLLIALVYNQNIHSKNSSGLHQLAEENNLNLHKTEFSSSLLLGLDKSNRKFIVIEHRNNEQSLIIGLHEISTCELKTTRSPEKTGKINFISLNLMDSEGGKRSLEIVFYDEFDLETRNRSVQLQMAKRWRRYVQRLINEEEN